MVTSLHCSEELLPLSVPCPGHFICEFLLAFSMQWVFLLFHFPLFSSPPEGKKQSRRVMWDKDMVPVHFYDFPMTRITAMNISSQFF